MKKKTIKKKIEIKIKIYQDPAFFYKRLKINSIVFYLKKIKTILHFLYK